jgi:hypothetical protein
MAMHVSPGPDANRAFRIGMVIAVVAGLCFLGVLYWPRWISGKVLAFALVVLFPVYLLVAASILSVWLGFDKDPTDLERVYRDRDSS